MGRSPYHDITEMNDSFKGVAFKQGYIIQPQDVEHMLRIGKQYVFVWEEHTGETHKDDCARCVKSATGQTVRSAGTKKGASERTLE